MPHHHIPDPIVCVTLPSGNLALYETPPNRLPREGIPESVHWPIESGVQIAHEYQGTWFQPSSWKPVTDPKTLRLIGRHLFQPLHS